MRCVHDLVSHVALQGMTMHLPATDDVNVAHILERRAECRGCFHVSGTAFFSFKLFRDGLEMIQLIDSERLETG